MQIYKITPKTAYRFYCRLNNPLEPPTQNIEFEFNGICAGYQPRHSDAFYTFAKDPETNLVHDMFVITNSLHYSRDLKTLVTADFHQICSIASFDTDCIYIINNTVFYLNANHIEEIICNTSIIRYYTYRSIPYSLFSLDESCFKIHWDLPVDNLPECIYNFWYDI